MKIKLLGGNPYQNSDLMDILNISGYVLLITGLYFYRFSENEFNLISLNRVFINE